jgi:hypothetical protein
VIGVAVGRYRGVEPRSNVSMIIMRPPQHGHVFAVHLIFLISAARAQTAPDGAEMATGDVWISRGEHIYVPREALELPKTISPGDLEMATGDVWLPRKKLTETPQEASAPDTVDGAQARNR